jgi:nucleotide-binding universal stress UspA family protein
MKGCPNFERRIRSGDPSVEILKIIDLEAIDLVVMGTHGYRGLEQYLGVSPIKW